MRGGWGAEELRTVSRWTARSEIDAMTAEI